MTPSTVLCHHEAAHSVLFLAANVRARTVSVIPDRTSDGRVWSDSRGDADPTAVLLALLAGGAAERRLLGRAVGDGQDLIDAAQWLEVVHGVAPDQIPRTLARYATLADAQVAIRWNWIARVASALRHKRTMTSEEVERLQAEPRRRA